MLLIRRQNTAQHSHIKVRTAMTNTQTYCRLVKSPRLGIDDGKNAVIRQSRPPSGAMCRTVLFWGISITGSKHGNLKQENTCWRLSRSPRSGRRDSTNSVGRPKQLPGGAICRTMLVVPIIPGCSEHADTLLPSSLQAQQEVVAWHRRH